MTGDVTVEIDDELNKRLNSLRETTGVGPSALLRGQRKHMPDGLNGLIISRWLRGKIRKARQDHLDFVLALWESRAKDGRCRVPLTKSHLQEVAAQRERTGIEPKTFFKPPYRPPEGLTVQMVQNWMQGWVKTVREDHLNYILTSWRACADVPRPEASCLGVKVYEIERGRIVLSEGILARLRELRSDVRGLSLTAVLSEATRLGLTIPDGVNAPAIVGWLTGQAKSANPAHLMFVIEMFEAVCAVAPETVTLSDKDREALTRYHADKLIPGPVLKNGKSVPVGLTAAVIRGWLSGQAKTVRRGHLDWVLANCELLSKSGKRRVPITTEMRETLEDERERTGVGQTELLRGARDVPEGLKAAMISQWINGYSASTRKDYLDYVIERWKALPDGGA